MKFTFLSIIAKLELQVAICGSFKPDLDLLVSEPLLKLNWLECVKLGSVLNFHSIHAYSIHMELMLRSKINLRNCLCCPISACNTEGRLLYIQW